jgi:hypothetical protein
MAGMRGPLYWARRARDAGAFVGVNPSQLLLVVRAGPRFVGEARRYVAPRTILTAAPALQLISLGAVDDEERFVPEADLDALSRAPYSCGLFEFAK